MYKDKTGKKSNIATTVELFMMFLLLLVVIVVITLVCMTTREQSLEAGALSALEEEAINDAIQAAMDAAEIVVYSENLTYTSAQAEEAVG